MQKVNCIIVGVAKCGTTYLMNILRKHPSIEMCKDELHYFDLFSLNQNSISFDIFGVNLPGFQVIVSLIKLMIQKSFSIAVPTTIMSAPALHISVIWSLVLIPPPTINGTFIFFFIYFQ